MVGRDDDCLTGWRSGNRILMATKFSAPVQPVPQAHPVSQNAYQTSFSKIKLSGRGGNHPLFSNTDVKVQNYASTHPVGLHGFS
jgi:hypothetical protein